MSFRQENFIRLWTKLGQIKDVFDDMKLELNKYEDFQQRLIERKNKTRSMAGEIQTYLMNELLEYYSAARSSFKSEETLNEELTTLVHTYDHFYNICKSDEGKGLENLCSKLSAILLPQNPNESVTTLVDDLLTKKEFMNEKMLLLMPPFPKMVTRVRKKPMGAITPQYLTLMDNLIKSFLDTEESIIERINNLEVRVPILDISQIFPNTSDTEEEDDAESEEGPVKKKRQKKGENAEIEITEPIVAPEIEEISEADIKVLTDQEKRKEMLLKKGVPKKSIKIEKAEDTEEETTPKTLSKTEETQFLRTLRYCGVIVVSDKNANYIKPDLEYVDFFREKGFLLANTQKRDADSPELVFTPTVDLFMAFYWANITKHRELVFDDLAFWISLAFSVMVYLGVTSKPLEKNAFKNILIDHSVIGRVFPELASVCGYALNGMEWLYSTRGIIAENISVMIECVLYLNEKLESMINHSLFTEAVTIDTAEEIEEEENEDAYFDKWVKGKLY